MAGAQLKNVNLIILAVLSQHTVNSCSFPPLSSTADSRSSDWVDVVLELEKAQPNYSDTFGNGGSTGTLKTTDGGKTWTGSKLHINEVYLDYPITYDTPMCPEANATTYTSRASRSYTVGCDIRYTGSDIKTVEEKSGKIADCVVYCDQVEGCVGVVLQDTTCHLKSGKGQQVSAQGVQAAILQ